MTKVELLNGDCLQKLKELKDNSVDSVVTDPPYGIGFMNREWDSPKKHKELVEREQKRSQERYNEGTSPVKGGFTKGVQPGLAIGGAKEGKWFEEWSEAWAKEVYRVLKPGGYLLSFCAPRMYHRMTSGIEDAGFEIRDQIMWCFGSGFPKSHNIGKAIDKIEGNEREVLQPTGRYKSDFKNNKGKVVNTRDVESNNRINIELTKGTSPYEGWGTALKPAHEPIVMARKPFSGTVANNVLEWGTGGINIDGCRVSVDMNIEGSNAKRMNKTYSGSSAIFGQADGDTTFDGYDKGRFPANLILGCICDTTHLVDDKYDIRTYDNYKNTFQSYEENDSVKGEYKIKDVNTKAVIHTNPNCPCYIMDEQSGTTKSSGGIRKKDTETQPTSYDINHSKGTSSNAYAGEVGGASRFFYCPKTSKKDRNEGCDALGDKQRPGQTDKGNYSASVYCKDCGKTHNGTNNHSECSDEVEYRPSTTTTKNSHPTVKPTGLMAYLIRLVTPKGGVVLDPFMGSGSTGKGAVREGMSFIGIEKEEEYFQIAKSRIEYEQKKNKHSEFFDV